MTDQRTMAEARELLAAQYERHGWDLRADGLRAGDTGVAFVDRIALQAIATALTRTAALDGEVDYEVWQGEAFGEGDAVVAGSTSLADAQHYAAVYSEDAPAWVVEVTRRPLPAPPSALAAKGEEQGG